MRKKISTLLAGNGGRLLESGTRPSAPSKVIRMLNAEQCKTILEDNKIYWNDYTSTPTTKEIPFSESVTSKPESKPSPSPSPSPSPIPNIEYFTTKGSYKGEQVLEHLGIDKALYEQSNELKYMAKWICDIDKKVKNISSNGGQTIVVDANKQPIVELKDEIVHGKFDDICRLARLYKNVMLVGPAGTGKTTIGSQVAKAFDTDFAHISVTAGMSEAHLLGRMLFDGSYVESDFVRIYENGGVFLLDEFDSADSNCAVVLNSALANGFMSVPNRKDKPTAKRHPNCIILACANTWGTGGGTVQYTGRNKLDSATLDRFCSSKVEVDYDAKLEKALANSTPLYNVLLNLRKECKRQNILRIISTRLFMNGQIWMNDGGELSDYIKQITIDWTSEEKSKVGLKSLVSEVA